MSVLARIPVGVVVERRKAVSPWADFIWQPVAVLPDEPDIQPWTVLDESGERTSFYAGPAVVELHTTETGHYRDNLVAGGRLWVVLRPTGAEPPYEIVIVTADPFEGEAYAQAGDDLIESVPMPDSIRDVLQAFVAEHHVERTFYKRKRDRADKDSSGRRAPARGGDR